MGTPKRMLVVLGGLIALAVTADAGSKKGFANKPGGGKDDPIIEVSASIGPNAGARFSLTEEEANALYQFNGTSGSFQLTTTPPVIPANANNANQFIEVRFPFKIANKKARKSIMKPKATLAATSFLTANISITDETGAHVPGIAAIRGKSAHKIKLKNDPNFPVWPNAAGTKNRLLSKKSFVYIADDGDQDLSTIAAFGPTPGDEQTTQIAEVRVRIHKVAGIIMNGFWVLKMGDGSGNPAPGQPPLGLVDVTPKAPVTPPEIDPASGNPVVETFSKYVLEYSEPVVPWSVGFSAKSVKEFNAADPNVQLIYNGNTGVVPNPSDLANPYFPNVRVSVTPNAVASFVVPYDVRPINPNNLAQYVVNPLIDVPGEVDLAVQTLPFSTNTNPTPTGGSVQSAVTSLYNTSYNQTSTADNTRNFHTDKGRAFVNVPVSPEVVYYLPLTGKGVGAINLDGWGFETNDPATERILILTNNAVMCTCPFFGAYVPLPQTSTQIFIATGLMPVSGLAGSHALGCNGNTFADATGVSPVGIAGNPQGSHLGPPTPIPGVNEGSTGSTANGGNPFGVYPEGFETVCRDSSGNERLTGANAVGSVSDMEVGGFLDQLFFDTLNPNALGVFHLSFVAGGVAVPSNTISDPPLPNPPPLRLPVGVPPVDIVFSQQSLLKPAFVIEGDEVWTGCIGCTAGPTPTCLGPERILLRPNPGNPLQGDLLPTWPQSGPMWQTFGLIPIPYASRQQIGNFLYLADRDQGGVTVLNSNNFSVIDRIELPDPEGIGVSPDNQRLYVSNFGNNSVSVVDINPFSGNFHTEIDRLKVGSGPRAVTVQPDNEDVIVANFQGASVSIIDVNSQTVRKTLIGPFSHPWEVIATPRQVITGWLNLIYMAYIGDQANGDLVIYESGPGGATGFGADDIRWGVNNSDKFDNLRGMIYDPGTYTGSAANLPGGVYLAHQDQDTGMAMVTRIAFVSQLPTAGAFPPVALPGTILSSPGVVQRIFEPVSFWGGPLLPFSQQINKNGQDQAPFDVALSDMTTANFHSPAITPVIIPPAGVPVAYKTNLGANPPASPTVTGVSIRHPYRTDPVGNIVSVVLPDRMYVSFPGDNRIAVLDPNIGGAVLNTIEGAKTPGKLVNYYDQ